MKIILCGSNIGKPVSYVKLMVAIFSVLLVHFEMRISLGGRIYCVDVEEIRK